MRALETWLGVALFVRTTRSGGMTEAGERFLAEAEPAYETLAAAGAAASELGGRPSGLLRLAFPRSVVPLIIRPILASFAAAYPDIELEIAAGEEFVDITSLGFDAGMRMGQFIADDMTALRLTPPFCMVVVGSSDYLARHGTPLRPADLQGHACRRLRRTIGGATPWRLVDKGKPLEIIVQGPLIAGDFPTLIDAAMDGVGLAQVPEPVVVAPVNSGALKQVLAKIRARDAGLVSLLSGSPPSAAEAPRLHRTPKGASYACSNPGQRAVLSGQVTGRACGRFAITTSAATRWGSLNRSLRVIRTKRRSTS